MSNSVTSQTSPDYSSLAQIGDTILLISEDGKQFYTKLRPDHRQHTHQGIIEHNDLIGQPLGRKVISTTGHAYTVVEPSLAELMKGVKRNTQIIYPKEAGRIIMKLNIFSGRRVIEAGTGSGALTLALAKFVAPTGKIYSYESRPEMVENAKANLERTGVMDYVELKHHNIINGFEETDIDALFLDTKDSWRYIALAKAALKPSGFFGAIVPTTNQVTDLIIALKDNDFDGIEVEEIFVRGYKPNPGRLRPQDTMVGHTGYLIFARNVKLDLCPPTRRKKQRWQANNDNESTDG